MRKRSYNEQRELDQMEANITSAEQEVARLDAAMNDPATLADHKILDDCCRRLDAAHVRVRTLYTRWEELESKRK